MRILNRLLTGTQILAIASVWILALFLGCSRRTCNPGDVGTGLTELSIVLGDGRTDFVLYHPATGVWYQARNLSLGTFTYTTGTWAPDLILIVR